MSQTTSKLLVIDDDSAQRATLERQLDRAGYRVRLARDGQEGIEATEEFRPDMVLCDWVMPRLDGIEYCRAVKEEFKLDQPYIAMLTSRDQSQDLVDGLDAGADDFLIKPIGVNELLARVRAGLRVKELQNRLRDAERREVLVEMAVTLGHEINNPLMALFGHIDLIKQYRERGEDARIDHHVARSAAVAARIAQVARGLIDLRDPKMKPYLGEQNMLDLDSSVKH